jgi:nitrate/nitrite transporter NarK
MRLRTLTAMRISGITFINSLGNLGGFAGPSIVGAAKELTNTFGSGLYTLSGMVLLAAVVTMMFVHARKPKTAAVEPRDALASPSDRPLSDGRLKS